MAFIQEQFIRLRARPEVYLAGRTRPTTRLIPSENKSVAVIIPVFFLRVLVLRDPVALAFLAEGFSPLSLA